jgi:hypothetical protein
MEDDAKRRLAVVLQLTENVRVQPIGLRRAAHCALKL